MNDIRIKELRHHSSSSHILGVNTHVKYTIGINELILDKPIKIELENLPEDEKLLLLQYAYGLGWKNDYKVIMKVNGFIRSAMHLEMYEKQSEEYLRLVNEEFTDEDIWNLSLCNQYIPPTDKITLKNIKDKELAIKIFNAIKRYIVDRQI